MPKSRRLPVLQRGQPTTAWAYGGRANVAKVTSGYSGTPLPTKLGIKPDAVVLLRDAPADFGSTLGTLPDGVALAPFSADAAPAEVIVWFVTEAADLAAGLDAARSVMKPAAGLWICWPKRASRLPTDITEQTIRDIALPTGLVDNKVCAVDAVWSGLRLVIRRELR